MAELKTKKTTASVPAFLKSVPDEAKVKDGLELLRIFTEATGEKAAMWGTAIVGFGQYHYESERSSQKGDWPLVGFSPRKQSLTLYVYPGNLPAALLKELGPHTESKGCLYLKRLSDVKLPVLKKLVKVAYQEMKRRTKAGKGF